MSISFKCKRSSSGLFIYLTKNDRVEDCQWLCKRRGFQIFIFKKYSSTYSKIFSRLHVMGHVIRKIYFQEKWCFEEKIAYDITVQNGSLTKFTSCWLWVGKYLQSLDSDRLRAGPVSSRVEGQDLYPVLGVLVQEHKTVRVVRCWDNLQLLFNLVLGVQILWQFCCQVENLNTNTLLVTLKSVIFMVAA